MSAPTTDPAPDEGSFRSGFVALVGRPNTGKSTLTNAMIGEKIAITSSKPETTRHAIRGIVNRDDAQLVLVDTPGLHRPRTLLGERLNDVVRDNLTEVDQIVFCLPADQRVGPGDRFLATEVREVLGRRRSPAVIAAVTKVDLVSRDRLAAHLLEVSELLPFAEIVPLSAVTGEQVDTLVRVMVDHLPEAPAMYPDDIFTEESPEVLVAELVREAALEGVRDELPHSINVEVEEIVEEDAPDEWDSDAADAAASQDIAVDPDAADPKAAGGPAAGTAGSSDSPAPQGRLIVRVALYVERSSQKSIVIGRRGERLKQIGTESRREIQRVLDRRVHLDLHVKVAKDWQRDPKQLNRFGW